ncbi:hypothetical protein KCU65_g259, partial [Aureobasidium melanogenum]
MCSQQQQCSQREIEHCSSSGMCEADRTNHKRRQSALWLEITARANASDNSAAVMLGSPLTGCANQRTSLRAAAQERDQGSMWQQKAAKQTPLTRARTGLSFTTLRTRKESERLFCSDPSDLIRLALVMATEPREDQLHRRIG